ncbi:hypothetical protein F4780DRAFT_780179 [Xylariomycetidae sp. FL0641]|nr:hypothetical protein F4780DRAFT_780179 [Xylariomycetidae sp. FL0641]
MDELAALSLRTLDECTVFRSSIDKVWCRLIIIANAKYTRHDVLYESPMPMLSDLPTGQKLKLIMIPGVSANSPQLGVNPPQIDKPTLKSLLQNDLEIDPCVLDFLAYGYDGFHRFSTAESFTCIVATTVYVLAWTTMHKDGSTSGIFIERRMLGFFSRLSNTLETYKAYGHSAALLAFVTCLETCRYLDLDTAQKMQLSSEPGLAALTNFNSDTIFDPQRKFDVHDILRWSKAASATHTNIASKMRLIGTVKSITEAIINGFAADLDIPAHVVLEIEKRNRGLRGASRLLHGRAKGLEGYLVLLKERAGQESDILFVLLTHEDSIAHAELASATHRIAEHTRRDSSSMKTIAVMTMVFLPATFLAALFDLPFFDFSDPTSTGVLPAFKWYLIFTVPLTILVFLLWLLFNKRDVVGR